MKYTCWGAARQVTGSMHLLTLDSGFTILVDCGLDYEDKDNSIVNAQFPFNPKDVDVVILTHAHIDHSGNLPNLVKQGYEGQIICTEPTAAILEKLWQDSVNIQNSRRAKKRQDRVKLFGYKEIKDSLERIVTLPFYQSFQLNEKVSVKLLEAGHIIGAASIELQVEEHGKQKQIGFTGDLGNNGSKLIVDSQPLENSDYLITETTYGNRLHKESRSAEEVLLEYVTKTCIDQPGKLIIPAFSVGRTQAILFTLNKLFKTGQLPPIRTFADSPLALASTNIHNRFTKYLNRECQDFQVEHGQLFNFKNLYIVEDDEDVQEMDYYHNSSIVVSSAGMLEGGRIQQHIRENIQNPACTILIAGFCTPGTMGHQLLQGNSSIRVKGQDRLIFAKIAQTDVFSAHPDADGLKEYFSRCDSKKLKKMFFVHGEDTVMEALADELQGQFKNRIVIPEKGHSFELN